MSYEEKLDAARKLIEEHNSILGEKSNDKINLEDFIKFIKIAGGTSEERLKGFSYEDILTCMPPNYSEFSTPRTVKPFALAKDIAKIFRGKEEVKTDAHPVSAKKVERMSLAELVAAYDPADSDNAVGKRLKEVCKGEKFIVFANGHTIDTVTTLKLLQELKQGYPGRNEIDGKEVHHVGVLPDNYVDENPLYKNRPLRPDGTCDQIGRSWEGVSLKVRQLIRLAMETGELTVSFDNAHNVMDIAMEEKGWDLLAKRYRKAVLEYNKKEKLGELPKLRMLLKGGSEGKNPFAQGRKVL
jgi:hypothetical protein